MAVRQVCPRLQVSGLTLPLLVPASGAVALSRVLSVRRNRKKNLPSVGGHNNHVHGNQYEAYNPHGFGAKPLGSHLRGGESRGRATGGVAANTFDAYKPKTPNLDKRPPMTPNFEPFGRCVFFC